MSPRSGPKGVEVIVLRVDPVLRFTAGLDGPITARIDGSAALLLACRADGRV